MSRPGPLQDGDQRHLTHGSVRWALARGQRIVHLTGDAYSRQYRDLLAGSPVRVGAEQIRGLLHESHWPANLDDHAYFLLTGDDTLEPVA
jgi:hypothetical protein